MAYESEPVLLEESLQIDSEAPPAQVEADLNNRTLLQSVTPSSATSSHGQVLTQLLRRLELRSSAPVTSISSFMALVTVLDPPFKPRTLHRPWSISAGNGQFGSVEVHRYVPGRNFDVFNNKSPIKLKAYQPDARRTGDYYAVKRLTSFSETESSVSESGPNPFGQFADELRVLTHQDLHGHPNLVFLFGISHSPSRSHSCLAEPNLASKKGIVVICIHSTANQTYVSISIRRLRSR
jgi:hypothetical protein